MTPEPLETPSELDWKTIPDFPNYEALKSGRVRSKYKELKQYLNPYGYMTVNLHKDGKQYNRRVHRLILQTFNPTNDSSLLGCHKDGDRTNNHLSNLKWADQKENYNDARIHGTAPALETHGSAKLTRHKVREIRKAIESGEMQKDVAKRYGVHRSLIYQITKGKIWKQI